MGNKVTRRRFLTAATAGVTYLALANNMVGCNRSTATETTSSMATSEAQREHVLAYDSPSAPLQGAWTFRSRPDLSPPAVDVVGQAHDTAPGYIFVALEKGGAAQGGSMIVDDRGQLVWFRRTQRRAMDFKVQTYRGRPVLTWGTHLGST